MTATVTTFNAFVAAISITGVTRQYTFPPRSIGSADLPATFTRPPSTGYDLIGTCDSINRSYSLNLVCCVEAVGQNYQQPNYDKLLTLIDNALTAFAAADWMGSGFMGVTWSISPQDTAPIIVSDVAYWGFVATINARTN